jgi:hypothetical protein
MGENEIYDIIKFTYYDNTNQIQMRTVKKKDILFK